MPLNLHMSFRLRVSLEADPWHPNPNLPAFDKKDQLLGRFLASRRRFRLQARGHGCLGLFWGLRLMLQNASFK